MNEVIVVTLFLCCELGFEDNISLFHNTEEHFTNVQLVQFKLGGKLQKMRVCLTDKSENSACIFV